MQNELHYCKGCNKKIPNLISYCCYFCRKNYYNDGINKSKCKICKKN